MVLRKFKLQIKQQSVDDSHCAEFPERNQNDAVEDCARRGIQKFSDSSWMTKVLTHNCIAIGLVPGDQIYACGEIWRLET